MNSLDYLTPPDSQLWPAAAWELDWARPRGAGPYKDSPHYPSTCAPAHHSAARSVLYPGIPGLISDPWFSALLRCFRRIDYSRHQYHHPTMITINTILYYIYTINTLQCNTVKHNISLLIRCLAWFVCIIKQINVNISGPRVTLGVNWSDTFAEILHSRVTLPPAHTE